MEETLTRFSPEPRAAACLLLQSGASATPGDSDEKTDMRGDEVNYFWRRDSGKAAFVSMFQRQRFVVIDIHDNRRSCSFCGN